MKKLAKILGLVVLALALAFVVLTACSTATVKNTKVDLSQYEGLYYEYVDGVKKPTSWLKLKADGTCVVPLDDESTSTATGIAGTYKVDANGKITINVLYLGIALDMEGTIANGIITVFDGTDITILVREGVTPPAINPNNPNGGNPNGGNPNGGGTEPELSDEAELISVTDFTLYEATIKISNDVFGYVETTGAKITVAYDVTSINLAGKINVSQGATWELFGSFAGYQLSNKLANNTMNLNVGSNLAYLSVTAEDGSGMLYLINVTREQQTVSGGTGEGEGEGENGGGGDDGDEDDGAELLATVVDLVRAGNFAIDSWLWGGDYYHFADRWVLRVPDQSLLGDECYLYYDDRTDVWTRYWHGEDFDEGSVYDDMVTRYADAFASAVYNSRTKLYTTTFDGLTETFEISYVNGDLEVEVFRMARYHSFGKITINLPTEDKIVDYVGDED